MAFSPIAPARRPVLMHWVSINRWATLTKSFGLAACGSFWHEKTYPYKEVGRGSKHRHSGNYSVEKQVWPPVLAFCKIPVFILRIAESKVGRHMKA